MIGQGQGGIEGTVGRRSPSVPGLLSHLRTSECRTPRVIPDKVLAETDCRGRLSRSKLVDEFSSVEVEPLLRVDVAGVDGRLSLEQRYGYI